MKYQLWSEDYKKPLQFQQDSDEYPFAGYSTVLEKVYNMVRESDAKKVLDLGFGTGLLMKKLYKDGYDMYGLDMSEQIVEAGKEDMPDAKLYVADYSLGLPLRLLNEEFDMAISVYGMHHLDNYEQTRLIKGLLRQLKPGGKIILGGLAFETLEEMKEFRRLSEENWLYKGRYTLFEEIDKVFHNVTWEKVSKCAGIVTITK